MVDLQKKNALLYSHSKWEKISYNMVRQIPLKAYADTYTYFLFLIPIVNYHSSWSSSFISVNNENSFINGNQRVSSYWHPLHDLYEQHCCIVDDVEELKTKRTRGIEMKIFQELIKTTKSKKHPCPIIMNQ
jgi:hypothetical protein